MSQAEFDSYLSLLSKFLRLRSRQRAELADELRDHLDSRLDELLAQGKSREQAIAIALEEFGDAAVLAEDFSRLASRRKRRFVMRCTAASAAVVAAVVLLSVAFAPPGPNGPGPQNVIAQPTPDPLGDAPETAEESVAIGAAEAAESSIEQQAVAELDRKLAQVIPGVNFVDMPLREVLTFITQAIEADAIIDEQGLEEEGLTADDPVTLSLTRTKLSARTVLDFVLQPHDLTFVNRAGVIFVTTQARAEEHLTTKVYNVRDLLENATSHYEVPPSDIGGGFGGGAGGMGGEGDGTGGGGFFSVPDTAAAGMLLNSVGQFGSGGMPEPVPTGPATDLIQAIQKSTSGNWMDIDGQGGTLSLFNGLLVVRQTDEVHAQVQKLLDALREAGSAQPGDSVTVPKGTAGSPLRDLSVLADYPLTPRARTALLAVAGDQDAGRVSELYALKALSLAPLPGRLGGPGSTLAEEGVEQSGVSIQEWKSAISRAASRDRPLQDLEILLDEAEKEANRSGAKSIEASHLFAAMLHRKDGPIPAVLAALGLSPDAILQNFPEEIRPSANGSPQSPPAVDQEQGASADEAAAWQVLGLKLEPAAGKEGLKIVRVRVNGPAADSWFVRPGDLLVGLGKWNVRSQEQLATALENVKGWNAVQVLTVRGNETLTGTMAIGNK